jgi:hypothetical protein
MALIRGRIIAAGVAVAAAAGLLLAPVAARAQ